MGLHPFGQGQLKLLQVAYRRYIEYRGMVANVMRRLPYGERDSNWGCSLGCGFFGFYRPADLGAGSLSRHR
jgi:hypothetical protein